MSNNDDLALSVFKADCTYDGCSFQDSLAYLSVVHHLTSNLAYELWDVERCTIFLNDQLSTYTEDEDLFYRLAYQHLAKALETTSTLRLLNVCKN